MKVSELARLLAALPEEYQGAEVFFCRDGEGLPVKVVMAVPDGADACGRRVELLFEFCPPESYTPHLIRVGIANRRPASTDPGG